MLESTKTSVKPESFFARAGYSLKPDFGLSGAVLSLDKVFLSIIPPSLALIVRDRAWPRGTQ